MGVFAQIVPFYVEELEQIIELAPTLVVREEQAEELLCAQQARTRHWREGKPLQLSVEHACVKGNIMPD